MLESIVQDDGMNLWSNYSRFLPRTRQARDLWIKDEVPQTLRLSYLRYLPFDLGDHK